MTKRAQIETNDVGMQDSIQIPLQPGIHADDIAVVTDESVSSPLVKEYLRDIAFMEDQITFSIGMSENPHAPDPVECGVQGEKRQFYRGQRYTAPRKYVNALINVCWNIETRNRKDPATGLDVTSVERIPYQAYSISIHNDPAGVTGQKWLEFKMNGDTYVKKH